MQKLDARQWMHYIPEGAGEKRSIQIPLGPREGIDIEIRSSSPVTLNGVDKKGQTVFLDWGQVVSYKGRLVGFAMLEVIADSLFSYRCNHTAKWLETPDQTRLVVAVDESASKPVQDLIRQELRKYIGTLEARGVLADDVSVAELLDDIEAGDLEFEQEPDPFGLGFAEMDVETPPSKPLNAAPESAPEPGPETAAKPAENAAP